MVAEHHLSSADLIAPLFVREDISEPQPIESLPHQVQHTRDSLRAEVTELAELGVAGVILFGIPAEKDYQGSQAWSWNGIVQKSLEDLRADVGDDLVIAADLCLDEYTDHGHCGVLDADGNVDNDETIKAYGQIAVAQAHAGAHVVAPSGMMDGQVGAIRQALDSAGCADTVIMAYSAKYATTLYGPFRDAVNVEIAGGGDRKGYQQDVANAREATRELQADVDEGADIVMVKPALPYLDVISTARRELNVPIAAYHVSGEYSMVHAAAQRGWLDLEAVAHEHVLAIKRAGADVILTYFARQLCEQLRRAD